MFLPIDEASDGLRNDADDHALMLAASHDCCVEVWHLGHINGTVTYPSVTTGSTQITSFEDAVVDVAFSPDSTAIAVASLDGYVRFFLVSKLVLFFILLRKFGLISKFYSRSTQKKKALKFCTSGNHTKEKDYQELFSWII